MLRLLAPVLGAVLLAVAPAGCGSDADPAGPGSAAPIDFLPGAKVGELAEKQLEAEHLEMAVGSMTCPDLDWELNASVRCLKVSELSEGRRVKIPGTVTVTSTEAWGKLHVALDDRATEFGVDAEHLSGQVRTWLAAQSASADEVSCPYLTGVVGTVVRCAARVAGAERAVRARVTAVDADEFRTRYTLSWAPASPAAKASPTFVAPETPGVVD